MFRYYIIFLWTLIIVFLSFLKLPQTQGIELVPNFDKLVHFGLYFILGLLMFCQKFKKLITIIYITSLSFIIELAQSYLTIYRTGDFWDFIAGFLGGLLGLYSKNIIKCIKTFCS